MRLNKTLRQKEHFISVIEEVLTELLEGNEIP